MTLAIGCSNRDYSDESTIKFDITAPMVRGTNLHSRPLIATAESPNKLYAIKISSLSTNLPFSDEAWWLAKLSVSDSAGNNIFEDEHPYPLWFSFRVRWVTDELIELQSGDVGTVIYEYKTDRWMKKK